MSLPFNIIANADDFGWDESVNKAILHCYENGYINSTSLMTNKPGFDDAIEMIHTRPVIKNVGIHVNFYSGQPNSDFTCKKFLLENGDWNLAKTSKTISFLNARSKACFFNEIESQINKVLSAGVQITHLDSHLHLHTLPAFYKIFIAAAKKYKLKLRLAQTYNEGNYLKFFYRRYINHQIKIAGCNYSDLFETAHHFIHNSARLKRSLTAEVMLHPRYNETRELIDFYSVSSMTDWIGCLKALRS